MPRLKIPSPSGSPTLMLGKSAFATSRIAGAFDRIQITRNWCLARTSRPGSSRSRSSRTASLMTARPGLSEDTCTEKHSEPRCGPLGRDLTDDVAVGVIQELRLLAGEARARAGQLDAAPVLDDELAVHRRHRNLRDVATGAPAVEALRHVDLVPGPRQVRDVRVLRIRRSRAGRPLLRYPHTPWKPWLRVPRARQTSVSYACVSFPHCCCFPKRSTYEILHFLRCDSRSHPPFGGVVIPAVVPSFSLDF